MADRPVEAASAAPGEKRSAMRPPRPSLAKASESGDPLVQKLLGDRQTAQQNAAMHRNMAEQSAEQRQGHEAQAAAATDALRELGFE